MALNNLAELLARSGKLARASELAARAVKVYPNNPAIQDTYGWICFQSEKRPEAIRHLHEAVRLAPSMGIAHYHLGKVLLADSQQQDGLDALQAALAQGLPKEEATDAEQIINATLAP